MSDKPREPLIGYVVLDEYEEGMNWWSGAIAYPNPEGANLFWEKPEPFIEKKAFDAVVAELEAVKKANEKLKEEVEELEKITRYQSERFNKVIEENEKLGLQVDFLKEYYNPQDTSFRTMMETYATLSPEQKDKLINLSKALAEMGNK